MYASTVVGLSPVRSHSKICTFKNTTSATSRVTAVSYPAINGGASCFTAPPCLLNPREGRGGIGRSSTGYRGWHPLLFKRTREALRSRSKVKPQWGQLKIRSSSVKPLLILPHRKHSREVLYAGTGKTSFSLFRNSHSSTALRSENEES